MQVVYARQEPPDRFRHSIFLAGPTPRSEDVQGWREEALTTLRELGYGGVVYVPEPDDGKWAENYTHQAAWELRYLNRCDQIVFWIPRELETMPGFTTNVEFGRFSRSNKCVLGYPEDADKMRYLDYTAKTHDNIPVHHTLRETLAAAIEGWETLPVRSGGARYVPRCIWETRSFQEWYENVGTVGNSLVDFCTEWVFAIKGRVFSWIGKVDVWVEEEQRHKSNEWVFSRTDVAAAILYEPPPKSHEVGLDEPIPDEIMDTKVVLVREFRSPGRTSDGFVWELPGGSVEFFEGATSAVQREVHEETGLAIPSYRFKHIASRQANGPLSAHHVHAFAVELAPMEMRQAEKLAAAGAVHGEDGGEERCYTEVMTVREALDNESLDWTSLGLILQALG